MARLSERVLATGWCALLWASSWASIASAQITDCNLNSREDALDMGPFENAGTGYETDDGQRSGEWVPLRSEHSADFSLAGRSFTIEFWAARTFDSPDEEYVFFHGVEGVVNEGLVLGFRGDNRFAFVFWGNDLETAASYSPDFRWHHWACTYDDASGERRIYRDGVLVAQDVSASDFMGAGHIVLGGLPSRAAMRGMVDEVRVWDLARSQSSIVADMSRAFDPDQLPGGLVAYWPCDKAFRGIEDVAGGNRLVFDPAGDDVHPWYLYWPDADGDGVLDDCDRIHNVTQDTYHPKLWPAVATSDPGDVLVLRPGWYEDGGWSVYGQDADVTIRSLDPDDPAVVAATWLAPYGVRSSETRVRLEGLTVERVEIERGVLRADRCVIGGIDPNYPPVSIKPSGWEIPDSVELSRCVLRPAWAGVELELGGVFGDNGGTGLNVRLSQCVVSGSDDGVFSSSGEQISVVRVFAEQCLFLGNGSDFRFRNHGAVELSVVNSIVRSNRFLLADDEDLLQVDLRFSNTREPWRGEGNIDTEPLFVDADGPDDDPGTVVDNDYRLLAGSPGIDAGNNELVPPDTFDLDGDGDLAEPTPFDAGGLARFVDDTGTSDTGEPGGGYSAVVDIGPHEFEGAGCAADFNGDGVVNTLDVLAFLNSWSAGDASADFNGDGDVNTLDVLAFLNAWSAGCG